MRYCRAGHLRQAGLSLIELMVAIALGLLLINGALEMLLATRATFRNTDDVSRIQENGRFALDILARNIRMAGYRNPNNGAVTGIFHSGACAGNGFTGNCTANGTDATPATPTIDTFDRIAVVMDPPPDDGSEVDCTNSAVAARDLIANVFFIADLDGNGVTSLYCRGFNIDTNAWVNEAPAQPVVDGIDGMQFLYGISDGARVTRYQPANGVTNWNRVGSVRVALLVSSGDITGRDNSTARNFTLLDAPQITLTDRHNRQIYGTTVAINNSL